ncbi:MAG: sortase [Candidatus Saccharimonadales bacterium]
MDDQPNQIPERTRPPVRPVAGRPPIQWPVRAHAPTEDAQRAAAIARQHVERTYAQQGEPNQAPPDHTPQTHTFREQPYDLKQYHSAWQQYYHQYFYRYYASWWQEQKSQIERNAHEAAQAALPAQAPEPEINEQQKIAKELRQKVRNQVKKQSHKVKSSTHFKPLLAAVTVGVSFLLINYNQVLVGAIKQYVAPGSTVTTPVIVEPSAQANVGPDPKIIIPKIGVDAPVVYDEPNVDEASYQRALERGVVRLGNTANPGTKGNVVIGGHSSNNVFNAGNYKYVFVNLRRLEANDIFYLNYNGTRYTYKITVAGKIVTPTDVSALSPTEKPTVTLFTCDPPGTNVNRLIIQAEQIDPSPSEAAANTAKQTPVNTANPLPSVAPSLWDRIFR